MSKNDASKSQAKCLSDIPCCPDLEPCAVCDELNFTYRLPFARWSVKATSVSACRWRSPCTID